MLTGVVEVGLFCGMAKAAYFGNEVRPRTTGEPELMCISSGWYGTDTERGRFGISARDGTGIPRIGITDEERNLRLSIVVEGFGYTRRSCILSWFTGLNIRVLRISACLYQTPLLLRASDFSFEAYRLIGMIAAMPRATSQE